MKIDGISNSMHIDTDSQITPEINNASVSFQMPINNTEMNYSNESGLIQTIVTDKLSGEVIRKMPSDEYLKLLSLLDEMISGSIDKEV